MLNKIKSATLAVLFVFVAVLTVIGHYRDRMPVPNMYVFGMYIYGVAAVIAAVIAVLLMMILLWRRFGWPMKETIDLALYAACGKALGEIVALFFQRPFGFLQPYIVALIGLVVLVGYVAAKIFGGGRYVPSYIVVATAYCLFCDYVLLGAWGIKHGQGLRFFADSYPDALYLYSTEGILLLAGIILLNEDAATAARLAIIGILISVSNGAMFIAAMATYQGGNYVSPVMSGMTVLIAVVHALIYVVEFSLFKKTLECKNEEELTDDDDGLSND